MPHASVLRLIDVGRLGDAISQLGAGSSSDVAGLVLSASLRGIIGEVQEAAELADQALSHHLTNAQRAICFETQAKTCAPAEAQRLLRLAHELMSSGSESAALARFSVRYGRAVLNHLGIEAAFAELPRVRRLVLASGDAQAAIDLHLLNAETEAKRNKRSRSHAHLRSAANLLESYPNVFQWARLEQVRSNLAALSSDFQAALEAAHRCARHAEEAGWMAGLGSAFSNIGLFKLALGDIDGASEYLQKSEPFVKGSKTVALAVKDTYLQVLIAAGSSDARAFADELWRVDFVGDWRYSYGGLWHQLTRARLFIVAREFTAASELVEQGLPFARKSSDGNLIASMNLLAAQLALNEKSCLGAARIVSDVYEACDELPLEMFGELQRVSANVVADLSPKRALSFIRRADRLFRSAGLETARKQLPPISRDVDPIAVEPREHALPALSPSVDVLHSLSALMYVGCSTQRIAAELLHLVSLLGIAESAEVLTEFEDGTDRGAEGLSNVWGAHGETLIRLDGSVTVRLRPIEQPESVLAVAALAHLVRGIVERSSLRLKSRGGCSTLAR